MSRISNIAAYRFARLEGLKGLRERLLKFCKDRQLKGTILLAPEGVNLFVAGEHAAVEELLWTLRKVPGLEDLQPKYSESDQQPFTRMLVRLKKEIIAFGVDGIDPATYTSKRLPAKELKKWLDEGRPVVLYDTRNDYEVKLGTFKGAVPAGIDHFRDFPKAVAALPEEWKDAPVVTFCTGGIRCEKAAPFMEKAGFRDVYQLEGGILKYFEEAGGAHYEGECFVFDQRVGVDPALRETDSVVCYVCQTPLDSTEQEDPRYVEGVSCPHCYRTDEEKRAARVIERNRRLIEVGRCLPGSVAYDQHRPIHVPAEWAGQPYREVLAGLFPHVDGGEWEALVAAGDLIFRKGGVVDLGAAAKDGEILERVTRGCLEPEVSPDVRVLYEDEALVVLWKPAPLPMHSCGRYHRNTLQHLLQLAYEPEMPRPVHRLDANTTGLVICARTRHYAKMLQGQFTRGEVMKRYRAKVHGHPERDAWVVDLPIAAEACELGAREVAEDGLEAKTDFQVVERLADGTAWVDAIPLTGRTNQIRLHLWECGFPIVGDPVYLPGRRRGEKQTLNVGDAPMFLECAWMAFRHPLSGDRVEFSSDMTQG